MRRSATYEGNALLTPCLHARLQRKLQRADTIITLKKVAEILGIPLRPLDTDETD